MQVTSTHHCAATTAAPRPQEMAMKKKLAASILAGASVAAAGGLALSSHAEAASSVRYSVTSQCKGSIIDSGYLRGGMNGQVAGGNFNTFAGGVQATDANGRCVIMNGHVNTGRYSLGTMVNKKGKVVSGVKTHCG